VSAFIASLGRPELLALVLILALNAYILMGGADLGSGVWDLLATGPRRDRQRAAIAAAIGPIWEANHVWLVIVVVLAFTAFPPAFAALTTALHIPLALMLIGITLRGSAFVFRSYGDRRAVAQARWGRTFAIASVVTPLLLGTVIGTIAETGVPIAPASAAPAAFMSFFVRPWLAPFPLLVGVLTLALVAQLAATYLTLAIDDDALRDDFRRRALWSGGVAMVLAAVAGLRFHRGPALVATTLLRGPRAEIWLVVTALVAVAAFAALWQRRYPLARVAASAEVSLILWGWAAAQYPYLLPPTITIRSAAAPDATLIALLWALAIGAVLLIPSLGYLLKTFTAHRETS
jgi:cytochrome bd ubiquinol oxidase subunit II